MDTSSEFRDITSVNMDFLGPNVLTNVNDQVSVLTDLAKGLFESCVLAKRRFIPDASAPWKTLRIRDAIRDRDSDRGKTVGLKVKRDYDP
jgi:hypothetical protein